MNNLSEQSYFGANSIVELHANVIKKYDIALKYFYRVIDKFSPVGIYRHKGDNSQYGDFNLYLKRVPNKYTSEYIANRDISELDIYDSPASILHEISISKIIGQGVQGTVYEMPIQIDNMKMDCVLKKASIIPPYIYMKYVLLNEWVNEFEPSSMRTIGTELSKILRYLHQDEIYYLNKYSMKNSGYNINNKTEMMELLGLYKYICMNEVLNKNSDANTDVLITWLCSNLVINKHTPAFPLLYTSFKTDDSLSSDVGVFATGIDEKILGIFKYDVTKYIYPHQYMAVEKLDTTLYEVLRGPLFDMNDNTMEVLSQRYMSLIAQLVFALFVAQKKLGYVSNDLHSMNVMLSTFVGEFFYTINEMDLDNVREIFPEDLFPSNDNGDIFIRIPTNIGLVKIIDQGRATISLNNGFEVGSRTTNFVAESYGVKDYDPHDFNNDLLRIMVEIYEPEFVSELLEREKMGISSNTERSLLGVFRQAFQCRHDDKGNLISLFQARKHICDAEAFCQQVFDYFGAFGFGSQDEKCTITNKTTPDSLIKYLSMFSFTGAEKDDFGLYYSMINE